MALRIENKKTLFACTAAHMMNHIHMFILPTLMPVFQRSFNLSYSQCAYLLASYFLGLAVLNPVAGIWAMNHSKKIIVVIGISSGGLLLLLLSAVNSYVILPWVLVLYGACLTLYHPAGTTILANSFDQTVRGKVMGIHSFGSNVGMIIGPILVGLFLRKSTYHVALWFFCILSLVVAAVAIWLIRDIKYVDKAVTTETSRLLHHELLYLIKKQKFSLALISYGFRDSIYWGLFIFLPLYLVHQFSVSEGAAAGALGLLPTVGLVATMTGGFVGDRLGRIQTITGVLMVVGLCFLSVLVSPSHRIVFYFLMLIATFGIFSTVPLFDAVIADITQVQFRSLAYGYFFGLGCLLGGLVIILGGALSDLFSPQIAFFVLGICSLICAGLVWGIRKTVPI